MLGQGFDVYIKMPIKLQDNCTRTLSIDQQFLIGYALGGKRLPSAALIHSSWNGGALPGLFALHLNSILLFVPTLPFEASPFPF